jgi:DNA processing protein
MSPDEQQSLLDVQAPSWSGEQLAGLLRIKGIGPAAALKIANAVPDPARWDAARARGVVRQGTEVPDSLPESVGAVGDARPVGYFDAEYPSALRSIPNNPPAVLWVRGRIPDLAKAVAVVGTRNPDSYGSAVARRIGRRAAERGVPVVSGLALGCDTAAHQGCLEGGGIAVAFLGGNLLDPQPRKNRELAKTILETGGALITEVEPSVEVRPNQLVERDRLQCGSSSATIVVQTGIPGGTLHTARFTLEQSRILAVVKPPPDATEGWAGNKALLSELPDLASLKWDKRRLGPRNSDAMLATVCLTDKMSVDALLERIAK